MATTTTPATTTSSFPKYGAIGASAGLGAALLTTEVILKKKNIKHVWKVAIIAAFVITGGLVGYGYDA